MDHIFSEGDIVYLKKDMIDKYIDNHDFDGEEDLLYQYPMVRTGMVITEIDKRDDDLPYEAKDVNGTNTRWFEEEFLTKQNPYQNINRFTYTNQCSEEPTPELCPQAHDQKEYCGEKVMDAVRLLCKGH